METLFLVFDASDTSDNKQKTVTCVEEETKEWVLGIILSFS